MKNSANDLAFVTCIGAEFHSMQLGKRKLFCLSQLGMTFGVITSVHYLALFCQLLVMNRRFLKLGSFCPNVKPKRP